LEPTPADKINGVRPTDHQVVRAHTCKGAFRCTLREFFALETDTDTCSPLRLAVQPWFSLPSLRRAHATGTETVVYKPDGEPNIQSSHRPFHQVRGGLLPPFWMASNSQVRGREQGYNPPVASSLPSVARR